MPKTLPFDEYLEEYERWFERHYHVYLSEIEAIRHFIRKGEKGIEIGVGSGRFALPLEIKEGIEPSAKMRELAAGQGIQVHEGVAENLPLSDHSYDFALMVTTICFLDDVLKSFRETRRILRPAGRFIIGLVDRDSPLGRSYERMKEMNKFYRIATFYSVDEVIGYLRETGFGDIETVQTVFGDLEWITEIQPFCEGYGAGGFAAIKAKRLD
jgi:SAM-dependent methyltransferase